MTVLSMMAFVLVILLVLAQQSSATPTQQLNKLFRNYNNKGLRKYEGGQYSRKLGGSDTPTYFRVEVYGGELCDGPVREHQMLPLDTCLQMHNFRASPDDDAIGSVNAATMNITESFLFTLQLDPATNKDRLVKKSWLDGKNYPSKQCGDDGTKVDVKQFFTQLDSGYYSSDLLNNQTLYDMSKTFVGECQSLFLEDYPQFDANSVPSYTSLMVYLESGSQMMGDTGVLGVRGDHYAIKQGNTCDGPITSAQISTFDFNKCNKVADADYPAEIPATTNGGNNLLYATTQYAGLKYSCENGQVVARVYEDNGCTREIQSESYNNQCRFTYTEDTGSASHQLENTLSGYIFENYHCSEGVSTPTYPKEGQVVSSQVEMRHKWAHAVYYTESDCQGQEYARDSGNAGKLFQCMPADAPTANGFPTRSYYIACGQWSVDGTKESGEQWPYQGFKKYYFNNMNCVGDPVNITYSDSEQYATTNSVHMNNGTCVTGEDATLYLGFQAKSYKYVCDNYPPQGMGVTSRLYTEANCGGFQTKGSSFNFKLGTNWSAPSQSVNANPNSAPYLLSTTCSGGVFTNTWASKSSQDVMYTTLTNTKRSGCQMTSPYTNAGRPGSTGYYTTSMECDYEPSPPPVEGILSSAHIISIVLGTLLGVWCVCALIYWAFMYGPLEKHNCWKQDLEGSLRDTLDGGRTNVEMSAAGTGAGAGGAVSGAPKSKSVFGQANPLHGVGLVNQDVVPPATIGEDQPTEEL
jgi:hypothetical protein